VSTSKMYQDMRSRSLSETSVFLLRLHKTVESWKNVQMYYATPVFIVVMGRGTARSSNQAPNNATQTK